MYYIIAHLVTFSRTTKYDNTAKCQNSLYIGKFYIIVLILQQYNKFWIPFTTILMQRYRFCKSPFCFWRAKNVHTKPCEYRTARQIWVARVPGSILTTCCSLNFYTRVLIFTHLSRVFKSISKRICKYFTKSGEPLRYLFQVTN